ncbi:MAG: IMP cyclohydrolase [Clostridia bacterium]|nr:IMP cyclohydrolase [Clostridia bacterium]
MAFIRKSMARALKGNSYPGRGIVIGKSSDGRKAFFAYFIMGRSENSRNRVFVEYDGEVKTEPFDASKVTDPSLIIYSPIKTLEKDIIVTNGDQTDTIEESVLAGHCFRHALKQRTFEPDEPNYTPRISGIIHLARKSFTYEMSILKSADGKGKKCNRYFFDYEPVNGVGHFIHTYEKDGNPLPSFTGEPERVMIGNDLQEFAEEIWNNLDEANKISLYCRAINLRTWQEESVLINKYQK